MLPHALVATLMGDPLLKLMALSPNTSALPKQVASRWMPAHTAHPHQTWLAMIVCHRHTPVDVLCRTARHHTMGCDMS